MQSAAECKQAQARLTAQNRTSLLLLCKELYLPRQALMLCLDLHLLCSKIYLLFFWELPHNVTYYSHISSYYSQISLRASSKAFGHRKTLRRSVGVVDLLVVLSDSAIESLLEVAIIHVQSYTWLYCRLGCAARGGRVARV